MQPKTIVLIIDDDSNLCASIRCGLEATHAFEAHMATSGVDGLALAREKQPDIILLDVMMPDMGGGEVAKILRDDATTRDIPVIFLTGLLSKAEAGAHRGEAGGCAYLAKPSSMAEITAAIRSVLAEHAAASGAPAQS